MSYSERTANLNHLIKPKGGPRDGIHAETEARSVRLQNRFLTGLDIARYTAAHHAQATWRPMTPTRAQLHPVELSAAGTASSPSSR